MIGLVCMCVCVYVCVCDGTLTGDGVEYAGPILSAVSLQPNSNRPENKTGRFCFTFPNRKVLASHSQTGKVWPHIPKQEWYGFTFPKLGRYIVSGWAQLMRGLDWTGGQSHQQKPTQQPLRTRP